MYQFRTIKIEFKIELLKDTMDRIVQKHNSFFDWMKYICFFTVTNIGRFETRHIGDLLEIKLATIS